MLGWLALGRGSIGLERSRLEDGVVHDGTVRRGIGCRRANGVGAAAPDLLELGRGDIRTVVSSNSGPELLAASLVDGAKAIGIDNLWLVSNLGVNAETIVWLRRTTGGKSARLGEENLVLRAAGRVGYRASTDMRAARVAHRRAVTRRLRVGILFGDHAIGSRSSGRAARGGRGDRVVALAAVATVRELVVVEAAGELSLLEVCCNVLVRHLLHTGLEEVVFLSDVRNGGNLIGMNKKLTSSSDQDLFPPADILRARRLEESVGDCEFISGRGERIWGWW